jgi:anti-sigma regulatory factor (Ser/Thr protein kinase)
VFPFYIGINAHLQIDTLGPAWRNLFRGLPPQLPLTTLFRIERPAIEPSFRGLIDAEETLLLSHVSSQIRIEGPLIPVGMERALLIGRPTPRGPAPSTPDRGWEPLNQLFAIDAVAPVVDLAVAKTDTIVMHTAPRALDRQSSGWDRTRPDVLFRYRSLMADVHLLRDASAVTLGLVRLTVQPTRVSEIVALLLDLYRPEAERKHQRLVADVRCPDLVVDIDRDRMVQILGSLLSNAFKFTTAGGVVTLRALRRTGQLHIEVEDTGIGILPEFHGRIFEQFMEVPDRLYRDPKRGVGVGLYLARALARLHGGDVTVASQPGAGSTFTVWLPA